MRISDWSSDVCSSDLAVLPELPELRSRTPHGALDVLPAAARSARTAQARQRPVRLGRANRLGGRGPSELRAPGDPKSVVEGNSGFVRVDSCGSRVIYKKTQHIDVVIKTEPVLN